MGITTKTYGPYAVNRKLTIAEMDENFNFLNGPKTADFLPNLDNEYTLGNTEFRWKSLSLGQGTLYITDTTDPNIQAALTVTNGVLQINGANQLQVGEIKFVNNTIESISGTTDIQIGLTASTANLVLNRNTVIASGKSLTFGDGSVQNTAYQAPYRIITGTTTAITVNFATDYVIHGHLNQGALSINLTNFTPSKTVEVLVSIGVTGGSSIVINGISGSNVSNGGNVFSPLTKQFASFRFYCVDGTAANTFCVAQIS